MTNRHYEIVFLVHPDQGEQVPSLIQRYRTLIESNNGQTHRLEDWGRRQLAYPIKKTSLAHYILMNVECNDKVLAELEHSFRFHDAILRNMILRCQEAITAPSAMMRAATIPTADAKIRTKEGERNRKDKARVNITAPFVRRSNQTPNRISAETAKPSIAIEEETEVSAIAETTTETEIIS